MVHKRKQPPIHLNSPKLFKFNVICDTDNDQKQVDIVQKETGLDQDDLINSLPDDALITIFEMLSCVDRLNVEAVSHRWRRLALNRSWSQFKHFSIEYLTRVVYDPRMKSSKQLSLLRDKLNPGGIYYLNITWFESLFRRCSSYIQELVLTDFHCFRHRNVTLLKTLKRDFWNMDFSGIIPVAGNQQSQNLKIEAAEQDYNESPCRRTSRKYKPKYTIYEDNLIYTSTISLPRLQHLSMHEIQLESLDLQLITKKFPNLKSIDLSNLADASFEGLTLFLEESQHLEFLRIIECSSVFHKYKFTKLPPNLKYLEVDKSIDFISLLDRAAEQCPQLHSFESYRSLGLGNQLFNGISKLKNLKYLSLYLGAGNEQHFMEALDSLAGVKALQLYGYINKDGKLLQAIAEKCQLLEHIGINLLCYIHDLSKLLMMPMLTSISLNFKKESPTATFKNNFESFFTDITSVGRLKHFDTNAHLSTDVLCQGIFNCRPLKFLSWKKYQPIDYGLIFQTLDQMHKGEVEPRNSADPRILGIKLNKILIKKAPSHAYVKFYKTMQTSRVMRAAQFSQLSSVPKFAEPQLLEDLIC